MEIGLVRSIDIDHEMQQAYLDYAMSVIVARALPDARDGLKPVHRRILYAMYDMGLRPDSAYKKSARIVGEVLGKYHPHGDLAVYESMARMAQDFSMRYLLVDGQGNFGSVDGDPPAAMRYTEARLTAPCINMLTDIGKNTADFVDNFDGSLQEPVVLPAALPNLLVNGATGIAVGMSTNIPPHNLGEVVDALKFMLANWDGLDDVNVEDLMQFIKGPDFPTGGVIIQNPDDEGGLRGAYGSGRGRVIVQARLHMEEMERGRNRIIVTELPYMVNKSSLIERIAELSRDGRLEGLADLRDESDRHGMRIVIELSKTAEPEKVLHELYKSTPMRSTFGIIMLALVDGEPRLLSLKQALRVYLDHRLIVIRRRSEYELAKARQRAHILEGYRIALQHLDEVIELIKKSPDVDTARARLMKRFRLSELQAQAILDMQLRRLAALERKKIDDEYKEVLATIKVLEALLKSPKKMRELAAEELQVVKEAYGDRRRTFIAGAITAGATIALTQQADLVPDHTVWVTVTAEGLVSRTTDDKPPRISGTAAPRFLLQVNTRDVLYLVTENGEAAGTPVHSLPEGENPSEGNPYWKVCALPEPAAVGASRSSVMSEAEEPSGSPLLAVLFALPPKEERIEGWYVLTATRQGMIKKTDITEMPGPTANTFTLVKVNDGDALGWLRLTDGGVRDASGAADVLLATADGMVIRFTENDVRPMGLVAAGVSGIKLGARDEVVGMDLLYTKGEMLLVASDGRAKRCAAGQFPKQGRYGQGVVVWKLPRTATLVGMAVGKPSTRVTLLLSKLAPKAMRLDEAPLQTRAAQGKVVVDLKSGYTVTGLMIPWEVPRPGGKVTATEGGEEKDEEKTVARKPVVEQLSFAIEETAAARSSIAKKTSARTKSATKTSPRSEATPASKSPKKAKPVSKAETKARATKKSATASKKPLAKSKSVTKPKTARSKKAQASQTGAKKASVMKTTR